MIASEAMRILELYYGNQMVSSDPCRDLGDLKWDLWKMVKALSSISHATTE